MNKPITPNKFATDLWGMLQMSIDEAVAAEREACAQAAAVALLGADKELAKRVVGAIRARGQA